MTARTPPLAAERADLLAEFATARAAIVNITRGLSDEQAATRPTVSALCLGGLIKHVTSAEETWMRFVVEGTSAFNYDLPDGVTWTDFLSGTARELPRWAIDREQTFQMLPGETLADIIARYQEVAANTDKIISVADLSVTHPLPQAPWHEPGAAHSVRRVLLHSLAATYQHAGHADLTRETHDGQTSPCPTNALRS